jgi:hypothetical protein
VNAIDALVNGILTASDKRSAFTVGQVIAVGEGSSEDGDQLVTVRWMGTQHRVMHLDSYSPNVGDVVLVARTQGPLTILGRLAGTPPTS